MSTDQFPLSPELVAQASEILGDVVEKTPVMYSQRLSDFVGVPVHPNAKICKRAVHLKCEVLTSA